MSTAPRKVWLALNRDGIPVVWFPRFSGKVSGKPGEAQSPARESRWRTTSPEETSIVKPEDRVAGLLVLLYAQPASRIVRLTLAHVHTSDTEVHLQLGREPVLLPEPLAGLIRQTAATRTGHATIGEPGASPWLFPGGRPGRALSAFRMTERLNQLGIRPGQSRSTARVSAVTA